MQINKYAPIIPYHGIGEIELYSTINELMDILSDSKEKILNDLWVRYDINNILSLFFHRKNNKLFKITTMEGYCGNLFDKINVNTIEKEIVLLENTFKYDEFEEVWESDKGAFIEVDPITKKSVWITVYIKEMNNDNFDNGEW